MWLLEEVFVKRPLSPMWPGNKGSSSDANVITLLTFKLRLDFTMPSQIIIKVFTGIN